MAQAIAPSTKSVVVTPYMLEKLVHVLHTLSSNVQDIQEATAKYGFNLGESTRLAGEAAKLADQLERMQLFQEKDPF
jgi:hypothetical protein